MKMFPILAVVAAIGATGCGSSSTAPTTAAKPTFTANLSPSNETTTVIGADVSASGTMTITFNLTKDSSGNITAATADFVGSFTGFPPNTVLTGAHIHAAAAGASGSIVVPVAASGEITFPTGAGPFNKSGVSLTADLATAIMNNPAGYYFNVHTATNPGGAARGQLVRTQ